MKVEVVTKKGEALNNAINNAINDEDLKTWEIVENKKGEVLYSHSPTQWSEKAMLKPIIGDDKLTFNVTWWKSQGEPSEQVKGYISRSLYRNLADAF